MMYISLIAEGAFIYVLLFYGNLPENKIARKFKVIIRFKYWEVLKWVKLT